MKQIRRNTFETNSSSIHTFSIAQNDEIDKLRHSATCALLERRDVIIVASVSCIYGIGEVEEYRNKMLTLNVGDCVERNKYK